jgi:hypothetical protein
MRDEPTDGRGREGNHDTEDGARPRESDRGRSRTDDEPLGDLTERVRRRHGEATGPGRSGGRGASGADPFDELGTGGSDESTAGAVDGLFEEMDVDALDPERVWAAVFGDDPGGGHGTLGAEDDGAKDGQVVPIGKYCQACRFFSLPPAVECEGEGEIVEVVDSRRFRVRNCPVVASRRDDDGSVLAEMGALVTDDP